MNSFGGKEDDDEIIVHDLIHRKVLDYCIVDTVLCDSSYRYFWDKKTRFFVVEHDKKSELLGVDFGQKLFLIDDRFAIKYNEHTFDCFLPSEKCDGEKTKQRIEVEFPKCPKYFVRFLVRGYFFNFITCNVDDIYGEAYPFKDQNAFYIVFVPIWCVP